MIAVLLVAAAGALRPADRDLMLRAPRWARARRARRGAVDRRRPCRRTAALHPARADLHRALRRAGAVLRSGGRPRRQPLARPPRVLRHRRLHRGASWHPRRAGPSWPRCSPRVALAGARGARGRRAVVPADRAQPSPMGTLGFALVAQIVANNWVEFTRGPLCVTGIPKPAPRPRWPSRRCPRSTGWALGRAGAGRALLSRAHDVPARPRVPRRARQRDAGRRRGDQPAQVPHARLRRSAAAIAGGIGALYASYARRALPGRAGGEPHRQPAGHACSSAASAACAASLVGAVAVHRAARDAALAPTWRMVIYGGCCCS